MYYEKQLVRALSTFVQQGLVTDVGALDIDVSAFTFWRRVDQAMTQETAAALVSVTLTDSTTNYVFVDEASITIIVGLAPPGPNQFPLAEIITAGGDIVSITDKRSLFGLPWDLARVYLFGKGQLIAHDGASEVIFPVGPDGAVLTAASGSPTGFDWDPCPPPGPHSATHRGLGSDTIPLADISDSGLLLPTLGDPSLFLDSTHGWSTPPTVTSGDPGYIPAFPIDNQTAFLGDGSYGLPDKPIFVAMGIGSPGGGLITWSQVINDPVGSFSINGVTTEISFPSNGFYNIDLKLAQLGGFATEMQIKINGAVADQSGTTESGFDTLVGFATVTISSFATDKLLITVPAGGVDFSATNRNRIRITKYKNL